MDRVSPRTSERRSPRALAHDPPVTRLAWTVPADMPLDAFLADARRRGGWDDVAWERLLRHAGIHVDRRRLELDGSPPSVVAAGASVVAYAFEREPVRPELPESALLLDGHGLVAVDKPPWWAVQGTRATRLFSLERELRRRTGCAGLAPVQRLDRETTGVQVFARDARVAGEVGRQFASRAVLKEYDAIVAPPPDRDAFAVSGPMARVEHPSHSLFALGPEGAPGKASATEFEVVARGAGRARVVARPSTGRTHQIRVHLASHGCAIVGDSLYGAGWLEGDPRSAERLQLHARRIVLRAGGLRVAIEAPEPADFVAIG